MKDFNNTTANVGQKILAIDALVQTAASKAYIISVEPGQELPIGVQNASYRGQDAAFIRVESDGYESRRECFKAWKKNESTNCLERPSLSCSMAAASFLVV
jgi:hypothetical protein